MASISFSDEASEAFANTLQHFEGWTVKVTPEEGESFDATLVGSAADETDDYFGVAVRRWSDDEDGPVGPVIRVIVKDLEVY